MATNCPDLLERNHREAALWYCLSHHEDFCEVDEERSDGEKTHRQDQTAERLAFLDKQAGRYYQQTTESIKKITKINRAMAFLTFALALVAAWQGHSAYRSLKLAQRVASDATSQAIDARRLTLRQLDLTRKDERAWLTIVDTTKPADQRLDVNQPLGTTLSITNTGKTPARNVAGRFYIEIIPENVSAPNYDPHQHLLIMTIVAGLVTPNAPLTFPLVRGDIARPQLLTIQEITAVETGHAWVATHGMITYDDVFKTHHWLKSCGNIVLRGPVISGTISESMRKGTYSCAKYNDTDNN
jgi:hypothetical protein